METRILKALLLFCLVLAAVWFLIAARAVLLPFLLAAVLAYLLNPLVSFLELRGVRRNSASIGVFLFLAAVLALVFYGIFVGVMTDLPRLREHLPEHVSQARDAVSGLQAALSEKWPWLREKNIFEKGFQEAAFLGRKLLAAVPTYLTSALSAALYLVLVPFAGFFFLRGGRGLVQRGIDACPGRWLEKFLSLVYEIDHVMGNYVRGVLLEALAVGVILAGGLLCLGMENTALLATAAGFGNLVPYVGPNLAAILGVGMAFLQFHNFADPLKVAALFAAVQLFDGWVLQPFVMRRSVNLHPVAVIFALLCGGELGGMWGLMFAVPVASVLKEVARVGSLWYLAERKFQPASQDFLDAAAKPWVV